jgi:hypothetical protein
MCFSEVRISNENKRIRETVPAHATEPQGGVEVQTDLFLTLAVYGGPQSHSVLTGTIE